MMSTTSRVVDEKNVQNSKPITLPVSICFVSTIWELDGLLLGAPTDQPKVSFCWLYYVFILLAPALSAPVSPHAACSKIGLCPLRNGGQFPPQRWTLM